jgi:Dolichyl-phosphate-mannose-protein mannosyltransferase
MLSPTLVTLLLIVTIVVISIIIAWVSHNLSKRQLNKKPEQGSVLSSSWLARLKKWFKNSTSSKVPQPHASRNLSKSLRITSDVSSLGTTVQFKFELLEGERISVIADGTPQAAAPILLSTSDSVETFNQVSQNFQVELMPGEGHQELVPPSTTQEEYTAHEIQKVDSTQGPAAAVLPASAAEEEVLDEVAQKRLAATPDTIVDQAQLAKQAHEKSQSTILRVVLVIVPIGLALLAPILVVLDRWRGVNLSAESLDKLWSSIAIFSHLVYPPYFIFVFGAVIGIIVLVWLIRLPAVDFVMPEPADHQVTQPAVVKPGQRLLCKYLLGAGSLIIIITFLLQIKSQKVYGLLFLLGMLLFFSGWIFYEVNLISLWGAIKNNWKPVCTFGVFHIFLLKSLSSFYSNKHMLWVWITLAVISLAYTIYKYRRRIPVVLWVMSLALVLYTIRINGWEFSVIGDEYSFFMYAQELAKQHNLLFSIDKLFNGVAVFGSHPFFSSFLQMISVRLFTGSDFGWRFSNLYLSALALVFLYLFFRNFIKPTTALLAISFLAVSHYIMTFGKIGYNNLQSYFVLSLVLAAGVWAVRSKAKIACITLGISLGACFYVYPAALYALPIGFLLLIFYDAPFSRPALRRWVTTLLSFGILILPLILQKDYWSAKIPGTIFYTPEIMASPTSLLSHFASNLLYAFLSFIYIPQESHFVVSSYVDPLSGVIILLGLAYLLTKGLKHRFVQFFFVGYVAMLFFVGASHGGDYPPNTRMFLMLPWLAFMAAAGLEWLIKQAKVFTSNRVWVSGLLSIALVGVVALNLFQAYGLSKQRSTGSQSPAMLFVRILERIQAQKPTDQKPLTIWFLTVPPWGIDGYRLFLTTYDIPETMLQLQKVDVDGDQLPQGISEKVQDQAAMVIIYPDLKQSQQEALGTTLTNLGKQSCAEKTVNGYTRFLLWFSPSMNWVCEQGQ